MEAGMWGSMSKPSPAPFGAAPRRDRTCPSAGGTRGGLLEPPQSFLVPPGWLMETQEQLGKGTWSSPEGGKRSCWFGMLAETGQEQLGKVIGWKVAISFSNGFQGYEVFWSVLTENKKAPWYFHHLIVKYWALDPEDSFFLLSPSSGLQLFCSEDAKLQQLSRLLPLGRCKGSTLPIKMVLDLLPILPLVKLLHFLELSKMSFLGWRNIDPVLIAANSIKR